jgi:hypothetical protein
VRIESAMMRMDDPPDHRKPPSRIEVTIALVVLAVCAIVVVVYLATLAYGS